MSLENFTLLIGEPRSGTSWVGKIYDSHPDVVYRHEPDFAIYDPEFPFIVPAENASQHIDRARKLFQRLLHSPRLKSVGQAPFFPKTYYPLGLRALHSALILALMSARTLGNVPALNGFPVPDMFWLADRSRLRFVLKSIGAAGRAGVLRQAFPNASFVVLLRHPCGHVRSVLEGHDKGKWEPSNATKAAALLPNARNYGLTFERLGSMSRMELSTWQWALRTELVLDALGNHERCRVVHYESICEDPVQEAKKLFAFSDLSWHPQSENFIRESIDPKGREGYYRVFRDPVDAANKWRTSLSDDQKHGILSIVARTSLAPLWPETKLMAESRIRSASLTP